MAAFACSRTRGDRTGGAGRGVVVAPNTATVGTAKAEATCIAPESLVRKRRQAAVSR